MSDHVPLPDDRETISEHPVIHDILKLPEAFSTIEEWAVWYQHQPHHEAIRQLEAGTRFHEYVLSYCLMTGSSVLYFGYNQQHPTQLVVLKRPILSHEIPIGKPYKSPAHCTGPAEAEARAVAGLQTNPYAVRNYKTVNGLDEGHPQNYPIIVNELIGGLDLATFWPAHIAHTSPQDRSEFAAAVGIQLARLLIDIHQSDMAFYDLKPENIMIRKPEGKEGFVLVMDFNSVSLLGDDAEHTTQPSKISLTTAAPETFVLNPRTQKIEATYRADMFSLGATLFWIMTGEYPYGTEHMTTEEELYDAMTKRQDTIRKRLDDASCPVKLKGVILKLLNLKPSERYNHMQYVEDALRFIVRGTEYETHAGEAAHDRRDEEDSSPIITSTEARDRMQQGVNGTRQTFRQRVKENFSIEDDSVSLDGSSTQNRTIKIPARNVHFIQSPRARYKNRQWIEENMRAKPQHITHGFTPRP